MDNQVRNTNQISCRNKTISELNEDCEILIKKEIEKCLVTYVNNNNNNDNPRPLNIDEIYSELKMNSPETRQLYFSPFNQMAKGIRDRSPKMLPSTSATLPLPSPSQCRRVAPKKNNFGPSVKRPLVDEPIQTVEHTTTCIPRSTVLSRTRRQLSKRNSIAQSAEIKYKTVKIQTENCTKRNVGIAVEPLDFLGLYEKGTNFPNGVLTGNTKDQSTQMCEHITQSELFCIEWIHKNLFEVRLSPHTLVVDDKLRDLSESACIT